MTLTKQLLQKLSSDSEQKISFPAASKQKVSKGHISKGKNQVAGVSVVPAQEGQNRAVSSGTKCPKCSPLTNSLRPQRPLPSHLPSLFLEPPIPCWGQKKKNCYSLIEWLVNCILKSFEFSIKWSICWFHQKN